jgi:hypothetical protein
MRGLGSHHTGEHVRPLVLIAALAVVLLASVSTTMATSASALSLVDGLRRDLGAVRVQLERIAPVPAELPQQSVAFNTDLGDGGSAFRHRSMATILRSAARRLESLATGYRNAADARRAFVAQSTQLQLRELNGLIHYLGNATDATSIMWSRKRLHAEALLDRMHQALVVLLPDPRTVRVNNLG